MATVNIRGVQPTAAQRTIDETPIRKAEEDYRNIQMNWQGLMGLADLATSFLEGANKEKADEVNTSIRASTAAIRDLVDESAASQGVAHGSTGGTFDKIDADFSVVEERIDAAFKAIPDYTWYEGKARAAGDQLKEGWLTASKAEFDSKPRIQGYDAN